MKVEDDILSSEVNSCLDTLIVEFGPYSRSTVRDQLRLFLLYTWEKVLKNQQFGEFALFVQNNAETINAFVKVAQFLGYPDLKIEERPIGGSKYQMHYCVFTFFPLELFLYRDSFDFDEFIEKKLEKNE